MHSEISSCAMFKPTDFYERYMYVPAEKYFVWSSTMDDHNTQILSMIKHYVPDSSGVTNVYFCFYYNKS